MNLCLLMFLSRRLQSAAGGLMMTVLLTAGPHKFLLRRAERKTLWRNRTVLPVEQSIQCVFFFFFGGLPVFILSL